MHLVTFYFLSQAFLITENDCIVQILSSTLRTLRVVILENKNHHLGEHLAKHFSPGIDTCCTICLKCVQQHLQKWVGALHRFFRTLKNCKGKTHTEKQKRKVLSVNSPMLWINELQKITLDEVWCASNWTSRCCVSSLKQCWGFFEMRKLRNHRSFGNLLPFQHLGLSFWQCGKQHQLKIWSGSFGVTTSEIEGAVWFVEAFHLCLVHRCKTQTLQSCAFGLLYILLRHVSHAMFKCMLCWQMKDLQS